jgi:hypothetical protein
MGGKARAGPKLPKRSVIERLTQTPVACVQEMMALLTCFKDTNYNEARCASQMRLLSDCVSNKPEQKTTQKSTIFYHLKRLYHQRRR